MKILFGGGPYHGKVVQASDDSKYIVMAVAHWENNTFGEFGSSSPAHISPGHEMEQIQYVPVPGVYTGDGYKIFVPADDLGNFYDSYGVLNTIAQDLINQGHTIFKQDTPISSAWMHPTEGGWTHVGWVSNPAAFKKVPPTAFQNGGLVSGSNTNKALFVSSPEYILPKKAKPEKDEFVPGENCLF